jgi:hypothetical protein
MNFLVTEIAQLDNFINDFICVSTLLAAPRIRNDAERTKLIAAFDNRHERDKRRTPFCRGNIPLFSGATLVEIDD